MKRVIVFTLLVCIEALLAGCMLGDRRSLTRTVSVRIVSNHSTSHLSVNDPDVQEVISRIETVLGKENFGREVEPNMLNYPGYITSYARYETPTLKMGITPELFFHSNRLDVVIVEAGNHTSRPNAITVRLCASLNRLR